MQSPPMPGRLIDVGTKSLATGSLAESSGLLFDHLTGLLATLRLCAIWRLRACSSWTGHERHMHIDMYVLRVRARPWKNYFVLQTAYNTGRAIIVISDNFGITHVARAGTIFAAKSGTELPTDTSCYWPTLLRCDTGCLVYQLEHSLTSVATEEVDVDPDQEFEVTL